LLIDIAILTDDRTRRRSLMSFGMFELPWWGYPIVAFVLTHITIVAVTVFLHRHQTHRALELHPAASHLFRLWLWLTTGW